MIPSVGIQCKQEKKENMHKICRPAKQLLLHNFKAG
jgi:hypothetical protein